MATPNMNLTLPVVGVTAGPAYASQINAALTVVDGHDHTSGSGSQITPAALNINADLTIGSNNLTDARTVRFTAQGTALTGTSPDLACLYVVGNNLYYNDGLGNQIAITSSGSIAGAAGNITGMVAPASVTFTGGGSPNYKFLSSATVSANLDAASILMRNPGVTATYALTLQAPTLASNYSITLPAPPAAPSFLQIDSSGIITAAPLIALGITSSNLAADSVTTAKIVDLNVTGAKIADSTITVSKLTWSPTLITSTYFASASFVVPVGVTSVLISGIGGGGGGGTGGSGGGGQAAGGAGGSSGYFLPATPVAVTSGETLTLVVGAGGVSGGAGNPSSVAGSFGTIYMLGGAQGFNGVAATPGGIPFIPPVGGQSAAGGGAGGSAAQAGAAGYGSMYVAAGTPGMASLNSAVGGGGGGGAGFSAPTSAPAGNNGSSAAANSGAGGQGGSGNSVGAGQAGGAGGSGRILLSWVPTT